MLIVILGIIHKIDFPSSVGILSIKHTEIGFCAYRYHRNLREYYQYRTNTLINIRYGMCVDMQKYIQYKYSDI
jgi:hypothetical protein